MSQPYLLAVGGAHIDRRGRVRGAHMPEASNPEMIREEMGGGAFNAARAAARRGVAVSLMSLRGGDAAGLKVAEAIEAAGVEDLSAVFLDRVTPSYTAILTQEGEFVTGLADMELYEHGFPKQLRRRKMRDAVAAADAVLCDANLPTEALGMLAELAQGKPLHAIAVSPAKIGRLMPVIGSLTCLFMNWREAYSLAGVRGEVPPIEAARRLSGLGLAAGVITAGSGPTLCFAAEEFYEILPRPLQHVGDATSAGDALAGACAAALMRGDSFCDAVCEGMAAARLAVTSEPAAPEMSEEAFRAARAIVPPPRRIS